MSDKLYSHGMYCIVDIALGYSDVPFFCRNDDVAKNATCNSFRKASPDSVWRISPDMYLLHRIGSFDCSTSSCIFYEHYVTVLRFSEIIVAEGSNEG